MVSIVVPIYNGSAYLHETMRSLLSQTLTDFEILAIDDGSSDLSREIVRSFADRRVRLIEKQNGGLCAALNRGIAEAQAPFIARSDQDDISLPMRLERQLELMHRSPDADGCFAYSTKFGSRNRWSNADKVVMAPGTVKVFDPLKDGCLLGSTMFVRTSALRSLGGFRQQFYPVDDFDLELRLTEKGKILVLCEPLIAYRFHTGSNTYRFFSEMGQRTRWAEDSHRRRLDARAELTFDAFKKMQTRDPWSRLRRFRKDSAKLHMRTAGQRYLDGDYLGAAFHLTLSTFFHPLNLVRRLKRFLGMER